MVGQEKRPLKVFLCHASGDKPAVRQLYKRLVMEGVDAWLDQEKLLPGQDWRLEIPKAVREADVVVICLSNKSITKEGYIQKEIRFALDIAEEKPEGTIFVIPARLEDCQVPDRLNRWQWVDLFDDNGSVKLLRSLRMRADMAGAVIEPLPYEDKEFEQRIEQLYTEGLAAFWVEDWDKACHRFQTILSERPSHAGAAEKLEEAERQRNLKKLYSKAVEAQKNQDWLLVISTLEDLLKKDSAYKDAGAMLKTAREEQQLKALYAEAKTLHAAQKWEAVIKVFEQISSLEKSFVDSEGLLASAQKEVAELQRLARFNELYSNAIHKMDSGQWYEARNLLEQVHKTKTGFLETEKLLSKIETEIQQAEDEKKRQDQINMLYEQAHGLLRSKKWRKALDKVEEIRKLDEQFEDPEKIAEQAQKELAREEQETERQNELSAMYAEAVRLVREEKYQEALEKWHEIRGIDSKYPDRQKVQRTARKSLAALAKPVTGKHRIAIPKSLWIGLGGFLTIAVVILGLVLSGNIGGGLTLPSISVPTSVSSGRVSAPTATKTSIKASSTSRPTATKVSSGYSDPTMYDDFNDPKYDGRYNHALWDIWLFGPDAKSGEDSIQQKDGEMILSIRGKETSLSMVPLTYARFNLTTPIFCETKIKLDENSSDGVAVLRTWVFNENGYFAQLFCQLFHDDSGNQLFGCHSGKHVGSNYVDIFNTDSVKIGPSEWHTIRMEMYPEQSTFDFYLDSKLYFTKSKLNEFNNAQFSCGVEVSDYIISDTKVIGYFDNFRIGAIEDDTVEPFARAVGEWEAIDVYDQSYMTLSVERVSSGQYKFIYWDEQAGVCDGVSGTAEFEANTTLNNLEASMVFICDSPSDLKFNYEFTLSYDRNNDQLVESDGVTWNRKK